MSDAEFERDTVQVQRRDAFGLVRIWPMNGTAKRFTAISGRKTLTPEDLGHIEALGFEIEWVPQTVEARDGRE